MDHTFFEISVSLSYEKDAPKMKIPKNIIPACGVGADAVDYEKTPNSPMTR